MRPWSILLLIVAGLTILALALAGGHVAPKYQPDASATIVAAEATTPVIVELFTSEGCSSCPPADAVLAELQKKQPVPKAQIIALGEHVDYWNGLGWTDPFSSAVFSERQQDYARRLNANVYTPQMVIDGQVEFVGSRQQQALNAIAQAARTPKANLQLTRTSQDRIQVTATDLPRISPGDKLDIVLALTETNLSTNVARGENAGRKLHHITVTRHLQVIGEAPRAEAGLPWEKSWRPENLQVVAFLQERLSRRIVGAAVRQLRELQP